MAFASTTEFEVRTTGSDANGGGFNTASTGTDFSQQNSPQVAFTDLVIGATNTQITSVANPFSSVDVGNIINVTGGTGFTVQRIQVVSVAGVIATCDKAVGTAASTGGTGNLGGGLATPALAIPLISVSGMTCWIKSGTYNQSATITTSASPQWINVVGYGTTHGDNGTPPILNMTASSTTLLSINGSPLQGGFFHNLSFTTTASTKGNAIQNGAAGNILGLSDVTIAGFAIGLGAATGTAGVSASMLNLVGCSITGCTGNAISAAGQVALNNCWIVGNTGNGIFSSTTPTTLTVAHSIIAGNGGRGIYMQGNGANLRIFNSTISNNTSSGIEVSSFSTQHGSLNIQSNIFYGNGAWGINVDAARIMCVYLTNNAYGNNTSGNLNHIAAGAGDVTLTANPFATGTNNFALNATSGGGTLCKGAGYPGTFPGGSTIGFIDIGAAQSSGGAGVTNYGYTG